MSLSKIIQDKDYVFEDREIITFNNKYGFIEVENPYYMQDYSSDVDQKKVDYYTPYFFRKPTPAERKEIIINDIIENNGKVFGVRYWAEMLAVSDRTIQSLLKELQKDGLIKVIPRYNKKGAQKRSRYKYIGPPCKFYGTGLTMQMLTDPNSSYGFRNWAWKCRAFPHDGKFYSLYNQCKLKFNARIERRKYLESKGLPLIVPEPIKYLTLRYTYWRGHNSIDEWDRKTRDGAIKVELFTDEQYRIVTIGGFRLLLWFIWNKDNPKIKIYDLALKEKIATFTWFSENIFEIEKQIDADHSKQFLLVGDFTTK